MNGSRGLQSRFRFRLFLRLLIGLAIVTALLPAALVASAAPPPLYARPTGHTIPAAFRTLWEQTGGADGLGWPLNEAITTNGVTEQWYTVGRIFQRAGSAPELAAIGKETAQSHSLLGADAFKSRAKTPGPTPADAAYVATAGHWVANGFYTVWAKKKALLGDPISEELTESGATAQYFLYGKLELDPTANNVARITELGVIGHGPADPFGTAPEGVDQIGDAPIRDIQGVTPHQGHWALVNLAQQHLWAYDGNTLVQDLDVSTGVLGHATPTGSYTVQQRFLSQEMIGPGYDLPNVPYVQYFGNDSLSWQEGYSLHGTYWHHNWGRVMSHGCVNLPTDFAAWMWDWATIGTPVEIIAG
ncbi:MAG: L,D-transpeptidase [Chloroflexota bacterium]|nr:L,D-transpeptidase [Chloroflexota bacterium]